nr:MAG: hypothetical protein DIU57_21300 [Pseudomonadota bacterium]
MCSRRRSKMEKKMKTESPVLRHVGLDLDLFERAEQIAVRLSKSTLLPSALRGKPADLAVIMITGHELGLSPMQALRGLHVVEGRPVLSADLIVGLVKKHPACKYFRLVESTDERATYETLREGEPEPTRITWTIQQAVKAGLTGRSNWKAHPAAMLRARASAALARAVYPDVAMGIYDPDEALDFIDVSRGVSTPRVEAQAKAPPPPAPKAEEEIEDAEIIEPASDPIEAEDETKEEYDLRDTEDYWRSLIDAAETREQLVAVGKAMADRFPETDHPIRVALRDEYARRQKELRGGA